MNIHLSDEAARYIQAHLARGGYRSPDEFIEQILKELRSRETKNEAERKSWLIAQETAAAKIWDNDADAKYDAL